MPSFKYSARDREGKTITGIVTAKTQTEAVADLRKKELIVLDVRQSAGGGEGKKTGGGGFLSGLTRSRASANKEQIVIFTRQLATMISAGVPLLESLEVLQEQADTPGFRGVLDGVIESVRGGTDLSTALERFARVSRTSTSRWCARARSPASSTTSSCGSPSTSRRPPS